MNYIEHFVENRFKHAKDTLRELDPVYVCKIESLPQLQTPLGEMAKDVGVKEFPKKRLNKQWHRLLDACAELYVQSRRLLISEQWLTPIMHLDIPDKVSGIRFYSSSRLWPIHANTLGERMQDVARRTINAYFVDVKHRKQLSERYSARVQEQILAHIEQFRHDFSHGAARSAAQGITEDQLWEIGITSGNTARKVIELYVHPARGRDMKQGKWMFLLEHTAEFWNRIDRILQDLERDLIASHNQDFLTRR